MDKKNVFISYSRHDTEKVDFIVNQLEQNGHSVWIDRNRIQGGEQWRTRIVQGIQNCDIFILVLSPYSTQSKYVQQELNLADQKNKIIVPVELEKTTLSTEMELTLSAPHRIILYPDILSNISYLLDLLSGHNLESQVYKKSKEPDTKNIIKLMDMGRYRNALDQCTELLMEFPKAHYLHLLAAIAYLNSVKVNRLRPHNLEQLEKHIAIAIKDDNIKAISLVVLGYAKYYYCKLNKQPDSHPFTLKQITIELSATDPEKIDNQLMNILKPTEKALAYLGVQNRK